MAIDDIDLRPPSGARAEARRGLAWRKEFGRGGTAVGIARARDIANGANLSPDTVKRMKSFFARHEVDKKGTGWGPGEDGYPSNGRIAWALWGGDPGMTWANAKVRQMENDKKRGFPLTSRVNVERSVPFEVTRAEDTSDDFMRFEGYAMLWNSPTLINSQYEGRFYEYMRRGCQRKSLSERTPVMQFDHGRHPMYGSLPMGVFRRDLFREDERGLFVVADLHRDMIWTPLHEAIRSGSIGGMSFRFEVVKDDVRYLHGDNEPPTRELIEIKVSEMGPVVFPAYAETTAAVRERRKIYLRDMVAELSRDELIEVLREAEIGADDIASEPGIDDDETGIVEPRNEDVDTEENESDDSRESDDSDTVIENDEPGSTHSESSEPVDDHSDREETEPVDDHSGERGMLSERELARQMAMRERENRFRAIDEIISKSLGENNGY